MKENEEVRSGSCSIYASAIAERKVYTNWTWSRYLPSASPSKLEAKWYLFLLDSAINSCVILISILVHMHYSEASYCLSRGREIRFGREERGDGVRHVCNSA